MGFRFQKRIKLLPGVRLNVSRKGLSTSLGVTGARVTFGHGQKRTTVGLPGSGISHTAVEQTSVDPAVQRAGGSVIVALLAGLFGVLTALLGGGGKRRRRR